MNYVKISEKLFVSMSKDRNGNSTAILRNSPANKGDKVKLQINFENSILNSLREEFNSLNSLSKKEYANALKEISKEEPNSDIQGVKELIKINSLSSKLKVQIYESISDNEKQKLEREIKEPEFAFTL